MTYDDLREELELAFKTMNNPEYGWGRFVYDYVDDVYDVAHTVRENYRVDCYGNDAMVENFLFKAVAEINHREELCNKRRDM